MSRIFIFHPSSGRRAWQNAPFIRDEWTPFRTVSERRYFCLDFNIAIFSIATPETDGAFLTMSRVLRINLICRTFESVIPLSISPTRYDPHRTNALCKFNIIARHAKTSVNLQYRVLKIYSTNTGKFRNYSYRFSSATTIYSLLRLVNNKCWESVGIINNCIVFKLN